MDIIWTSNDDTLVWSWVKWIGFRQKVCSKKKEKTKFTKISDNFRRVTIRIERRQVPTRINLIYKRSYYAEINFHFLMVSADHKTILFFLFHLSFGYTDDAMWERRGKWRKWKMCELARRDKREIQKSKRTITVSRLVDVLCAHATSCVHFTFSNLITPAPMRMTKFHFTFDRSVCVCPFSY